jgi:hypothetical protein
LDSPSLHHVIPNVTVEKLGLRVPFREELINVGADRRQAIINRGIKRRVPGIVCFSRYSVSCATARPGIRYPARVVRWRDDHRSSVVRFHPVVSRFIAHTFAEVVTEFD